MYISAIHRNQSFLYYNYLFNCFHFSENNKIPTDIINDLTVLVNDVIEWRKQESLSAQKQRLDAATEDMEKTLEQMGEIIEALNTMTKSFKDIDPKEALEIYKKIANKDEDKIANAVIDFSLAKIDK
ncbi:MAG: hypothetical protein RR198_05785 [Oscillospiraceae bacterium]